MMRNLFLVLALLVFSPLSHAGQVIKVKGQSALLDVKGESASPGLLYFAVSEDGKRRGILRIVKVKGDKAIGRLLKGRMSAGMTLELRQAHVARQHSQRQEAPAYGGGDEEAGVPTGKMYWGVLGGLAMDTMKVNVNNASNVSIGSASMSGTAFSLKGLFDYQLMNQFWFRGAAGAEGFQASGNSICGIGNNSSCTANLWYLSFDFLGRYLFMQTGKFHPWVGLGMDILFPVSKSASALDTSSISTTSAFIFAGGLDWVINPRMYVPISLEYGMLPKSDQVSASWITLRAGIAIPF